MQSKKVNIIREELLSDNWYSLKKYDYEILQKDGSWQKQTREVYDRGNGATILLYNQAKNTVILTRQFRLPTFINGNPGGMLIETCAGLLDQDQPDVAIIDLAMPPPGGLEAIRVVKRNYPRVGVLALSGTEDIDVAIEALRVGADGFLPKSSEPKVLLPPLLALAAGWSVMPRSMAAILAAAKPGHASLERLTPEERKLWRLVAKGLEGNDIAAQLLVSERTARRLIVSLLRRIGAANRIEAAALAGRAGLLDERWDEHPD